MAPMAAESIHVAGRAGANPGVHIISVKGAITEATAAAFQEAVHVAATPGLIVDLSEVPWLDSMAVGTLVRAFVFCTKCGRKFALVGVNPRIKNVLHMVGLDPLFKAYATVAEAESALS
jgi:anti-sigma B factor antagonist